MEITMAIFPEYSTQKRSSNIKAPDFFILIKGLLMSATGTVGISVITCPVPSAVRMTGLAVGLILLLLGGKKSIDHVIQKKRFDEYIPVWEEKRGMYDQFALDLNHWYDGGELPKYCDGDMAYFLKLQQKRLNSRHLTMINHTIPAKGCDMGTVTTPLRSLWYTTDMTFEQVTHHLSFQREENLLYEHTADEVMYTNIIHTPNEKEYNHMMITCPDCGAVSSVTELTNGCRYCGTQFQIKDLFPRVTNLFFVRQNSISKNDKLTHQCFFFCMASFFILTTIFAVLHNDTYLPLMLLYIYFSTFLMGGFSGLIVADTALICTSLKRDGRKRIPMFRAIFSKKKIVRLLRSYDRFFSYEKFESQIISLIRMTVFAEDPFSLTFYHGTQPDPRFRDIMEMTYTTSLVLQSVSKEGNLLSLTLRTWWLNYNETNGNIKKTGDCIDVTLRRDMSHPEMPGFSITSVHCPSCGGSFDAVRQHLCPYCGTNYHMENECWTIENLKLIR